MSNAAEYATRAKERGAAYVVDATDTFSNEDYPAFCEDVATLVAKYDSLNGLNMQRVNGVYDADGNRVNVSELRKQVTAVSDATKTYLGDGLYASHDGFQVKLTAENGVTATNTVYLEPEVVLALVKFLRANNIPLE